MPRVIATSTGRWAGGSRHRPSSSARSRPDEQQSLTPECCPWPAEDTGRCFRDGTVFVSPSGLWANAAGGSAGGPVVVMPVTACSRGWPAPGWVQGTCATLRPSRVRLGPRGLFSSRRTRVRNETRTPSGPFCWPRARPSSSGPSPVSVRAAPAAGCRVHVDPVPWTVRDVSRTYSGSARAASSRAFVSWTTHPCSTRATLW